MTDIINIISTRLNIEEVEYVRNDEISYYFLGKKHNKTVNIKILVSGKVFINNICMKDVLIKIL